MDGEPSGGSDANSGASGSSQPTRGSAFGQQNMSRRIVPLIEDDGGTEPGAAGGAQKGAGGGGAKPLKKKGSGAGGGQAQANIEPPPSKLKSKGPAAQESILDSAPKPMTTATGMGGGGGGGGGGHVQVPLPGMPPSGAALVSSPQNQRPAFAGHNPAAFLPQGQALPSYQPNEPRQGSQQQYGSAPQHSSRQQYGSAPQQGPPPQGYGQPQSHGGQPHIYAPNQGSAQTQQQRRPSWFGRKAALGPPQSPQPAQPPPPTSTSTAAPPRSQRKFSWTYSNAADALAAAARK